MKQGNGVLIFACATLKNDIQDFSFDGKSDIINAVEIILL